MICGLVLAGGRSRRMGREKAALLLGGEPMIALAVGTLSAGAREVAVNAPAGSQAEAFAKLSGLTCVADAPGALDGPLAGIIAGLTWATRQDAEWLATAPCDTPFLPSDLVQRLHDARTPGGAAARTPGGWHPLCALWPVSALSGLIQLSDHPPVRDVLMSLGAAVVDFPTDGEFVNVNTPEELERARRALGRVAGSGDRSPDPDAASDHP